MTSERDERNESITAERSQRRQLPLLRTRSWPYTAGSTDTECNAVAVAVAAAAAAVGHVDAEPGATAMAEAAAADRAAVEAAAMAEVG